MHYAIFFAEKKFIISLAVATVMAVGIAAVCTSEDADASVDMSVFTDGRLDNAPPIIDVDIDGYHYRLQDGMAFVQGFTDGFFDKDLEFPDQIDWNGQTYILTGILPNAFFRQPVETLVVPDTAIGIGDGAFNECAELRSIAIGRNVMYLNGAFTVKVNLGNLTVESALETLEVSPENETYKAVDNVLYELMTWEGTEEQFTALRMCQPMKTGDFTFPDEVFGMPVSYLAARQFQGCHISGITIPDTVEHIQDDCFCLCNEITELTIPPSVKVLGVYRQITPFPIGWCANLEYLTISSSMIASVQVTSLPQLKYLHITDSVDMMASNCIRTEGHFPYQVTSLVIGDVGKIENGPFQHFQFYESPGSPDPMTPDAGTLRNSAWWSTGIYEGGTLKMYRSVTITLDADGGTVPVGAVQAGAGGRISGLPDARMDGMVFDGWYDAAGKRITDSYVFTKDTVITAKYSAEKEDPLEIGFPIAVGLVVVGLAAYAYVVNVSGRRM